MPHLVKKLFLIAEKETIPLPLGAILVTLILIKGSEEGELGSSDGSRPVTMDRSVMVASVG